MIILILINLVFIIFIYLRYYNFPKEIYYEEEKIDNLDSMTIGYISDNDFGNNCDLILAEIIDLNIKEYITIEYSKEKLNRTNYVIKQNIDAKAAGLSEADMLVINYLFKEKTEITKSELEEKLTNSFELYNIQYNELEKILEKQMLEQSIIDITKQKELKRNKKIYNRLSLILIITIGFLILFKVIDFSVIYVLMYLIEHITIVAMLSKASIYTIKGQMIKFNIDRYKMKIKNDRFLTQKNTMEEIVKNKKFAISLALHIKNDAKSIFIDDVITQNAINKSKKVALNATVLTIVVTIITFVLAFLVSKMAKDAIKWLFILYTITIACITDSIFAKGYKRK